MAEQISPEATKQANSIFDSLANAGLFNEDRDIMHARQTFVEAVASAISLAYKNGYSAHFLENMHNQEIKLRGF